MNLNKDALLDELTDFASQKPAEIPTSLDEYLGNVAKTGDTLFPWQNLKPLLCRKLELVMNEFYKQYPTDDLPALPNVEPFKYEDMKAKILESINCFTSAPFTIQRLCELVVDPRKHYRRTDKFMRGLEKNVLVVSTVEPKSAVAAQDTSVGAVPMVNGLPGVEDNGINGHLADSTDDIAGPHSEPEVSDPVPDGKAEPESSTASVVEVQAPNDEASAGDRPPGTDEGEEVSEKMEVAEEEKPSSSTEGVTCKVAEEPEASSKLAEVSAPAEDAAVEKPTSPAAEEPAAHAPSPEVAVHAAHTDAEPKPVKEEVAPTKASDEKEVSVEAEEAEATPAEPEIAAEDAQVTSESTLSSATADSSDGESSASLDGPSEETAEPPLKKFHPEPESGPAEEPPSSSAAATEDCIAEKEVATPEPSKKTAELPEQLPEEVPQIDSSADCGAETPVAKDLEEEAMDQN